MRTSERAVRCQTVTEPYYQRDELTGKDVYSIKANHIVVAKDLAYTRGGRTALVVAKDDRQEAVPFTEILEDPGDRRHSLGEGSN